MILSTFYFYIIFISFYLFLNFFFFFLIETQEIFEKLSNYEFYIIVAIIDVREIYFNHALT